MEWVGSSTEAELGCLSQYVQAGWGIGAAKIGAHSRGGARDLLVGLGFALRR